MGRRECYGCGRHGSQRKESLKPPNARGPGDVKSFSKESTCIVEGDVNHKKRQIKISHLEICQGKPGNYER